MKAGEDMLRGMNRMESGEGEELEEIVRVGRALEWAMSHCWN